MDTFRHALVAASVGHTDLATLKAAVELAGGQSEVTLLDVFEPLPPWRRTVNVEGRVIDVEGLMLEERQAKLAELISEAGSPTGVTADVTRGKPVVEVIRHVINHGCDLVIVGEPAPSKSGKAGISSDVMQLLRKCPVPVWLVRPPSDTGTRILALVDPEVDDPPHRGLNDLILEVATEMARAADAELHVATAWEFTGEALLRSSAFVSMPEPDLELLLRATEDEHRAHLDELVRKHGGHDVGARIHLAKGAPTEVLPDLAEELGTSLVIMGTVARTGLSGWIMGNTADEIVRSVDCSVMALKPIGFVSPITVDDGTVE
ncbi:MAG: universal stress protein [Acidimicrobiia bacterium]|nr:universal stress protein [Acidimicrobiia bacterium]